MIKSQMTWTETKEETAALGAEYAMHFNAERVALMETTALDFVVFADQDGDGSEEYRVNVVVAGTESPLQWATPHTFMSVGDCLPTMAKLSVCDLSQLMWWVRTANQII